MVKTPESRFLSGYVCRGEYKQRCFAAARYKEEGLLVNKPAFWLLEMNTLFVQFFFPIVIIKLAGVPSP